jgi:catechol 2,3-dioxygenase-like lactoylglutathione lyase family enzyme
VGANITPVGIALISLLVHDYDEAIEFFVEALGFELVEDTSSVDRTGAAKRWVVVRPGGATTGLLLAEARGDVEIALVGRQYADRVGLFLHVEDFAAAVDRMRRRGVRFLGEPRDEPYGRVVVFEDLLGNKWDLLQRLAG